MNGAGVPRVSSTGSGSVSELALRVSVGASGVCALAREVRMHASANAAAPVDGPTSHETGAGLLAPVRVTGVASSP